MSRKAAEWSRNKQVTQSPLMNAFQKVSHRREVMKEQVQSERIAHATHAANV
jgi:hypothetical protein